MKITGSVIIFLLIISILAGCSTSQESTSVQEPGRNKKEIKETNKIEEVDNSSDNIVSTEINLKTNEFMVDSIQLGMPIEEAIQILGEPDIKENGYSSWLDGENEELGISVIYDENSEVISNITVTKMYGNLLDQLNSIGLDVELAEEIYTSDNKQILTYYPHPSYDTIEISYVNQSESVAANLNTEPIEEVGTIEWEEDTMTIDEVEEEAVVSSVEEEQESINDTESQEVKKDETTIAYENGIVSIMKEYRPIISVMKDVQQSDYNIESIPSFEDSGSYMMTLASLQNSMEMMKYSGSQTQETEIPTEYYTAHDELQSSMNDAQKALEQLAALGYVQDSDLSSYQLNEMWEQYQMYESLFNYNLEDAMIEYQEVQFNIVEE